MFKLSWTVCIHIYLFVIHFKIVFGSMCSWYVFNPHNFYYIFVHFICLSVCPSVCLVQSSPVCMSGMVLYVFSVCPERSYKSGPVQSCMSFLSVQNGPICLVQSSPVCLFCLSRTVLYVWSSPVLYVFSVCPERSYMSGPVQSSPVCLFCLSITVLYVWSSLVLYVCSVRSSPVRYDPVLSVCLVQSGLFSTVQSCPVWSSPVCLSGMVHSCMSVQYGPVLSSMIQSCVCPVRYSPVLFVCSVWSSPFSLSSTVRSVLSYLSCPFLHIQFQLNFLKTTYLQHELC